MRLRRHLEHPLQDFVARHTRIGIRRTRSRHSCNQFFSRYAQGYALRERVQRPHTQRASGGSGSFVSQGHRCAPSSSWRSQPVGWGPPLAFESEGSEQRPSGSTPGGFCASKDNLSSESCTPYALHILCKVGCFQSGSTFAVVI
jgi:hypothetical protein